MEFKYLDNDKNHPLIDHFYQLKINKEETPFTSLILSLGQTNITYVKCNQNQISRRSDRDEILYKGLVITGQSYGCYEISVLDESYNFGFALKPTSLYKILGVDISQLNNNHLSLKDFNQHLYKGLKPIFESNINNIDRFIKSVYQFFENHCCIEDNNIKYIDDAINLIEEKEGLIKVNDILQVTPFSQKKLELQFKKIIGLTPGKFIKQYRFMKLMRKYASNEVNISDLQYMFNYYDASHFSKDFQFFMNQTPTSYFKNEYPLLRSYLKE